MRKLKPFVDAAPRGFGVILRQQQCNKKKFHLKHTSACLPSTTTTTTDAQLGGKFLTQFCVQWRRENNKILFAWKKSDSK